MIITYKDYIIEPVGKICSRFDLYKVTTIQSGKRKGEKSRSILGYGYQIDEALRRIVFEELNKDNDTVTPEVFRKAFKEQLEEVKSFFRGMDMIK